MQLTDRINRIQISPTAAVISEAEKLKSRGVDIADFGPGEPDFPTPDHIKKAAIKGTGGSLEIPRTALKNAIFQTKDYQGITGPLTCISTGDCQSQLAVNIGVYQAPDAPTNPATPDAKPIFSETFTLSEALGT